MEGIDRSHHLDHFFPSHRSVKKAGEKEAAKRARRAYIRMRSVGRRSKVRRGVAFKKSHRVTLSSSTGTRK